MAQRDVEVLEHFAGLPDAVPCRLVVGKGPYTLGDVRRHLGGVRPDKAITTGQAAQEFGYSGDSWRKWADAGEIEGAWQDAPGGPWRLPYASCEKRVAKLRIGSHRTSRRGRPWKRNRG